MDDRIKIQFIIPGIPRPQKRVGRGQGGKAYNPSKAVKNKIALYAVKARNSKRIIQGPVAGPVSLTVGLFFSTTDPKKLLDEDYIIDPDGDNCFKLVSDALEGIFYNNDNQVCDGCFFKRYINGDSYAKITLLIDIERKE